MESKYKNEAKLIKKAGCHCACRGVSSPPHSASDFCVGSGEGRDKVLGVVQGGSVMVDTAFSGSGFGPGKGQEPSLKDRGGLA